VGIGGTRVAAAPGTPRRAGWSPAGLPAVLVLAGAVSVQSGAGIADRLFSQLPPASVTTLRLWAAALILLIVAGRSTARAVAGLAARRAWPDAGITLSFGIALGFMNFAIYQAFARIPLGIAVTIEFLGPLTVTVTGTLMSGRRAPGARSSEARSSEARSSEARAPGTRRLASLGYAGLAAGGVVLLAGTAGGSGLNWAGIAWAAAAGTAWAGYIIGSQAAGQRLPGASGLVIAMCVAALAVTAPGVIQGAPRMFRPSFLAAGAGIGLLSSVIPYWLELEALRRIPASLFGVWMSVQPAVAALIGLIVLGQDLSPAEWAGIGCVVAASVGAARTAAAPARA
jgi:inner membrane transporter RhtA